MPEIKILKISNLNKHSFHFLDKELAYQEGLSYAESKRIADGLLLDFSNFYELNAREIGSVQLNDFYVNYAPLRKKWLGENGLNIALSNFDFCIELIRFYKPDSIFDHAKVFKGRVDEIKKQFPFLKSISTWDCYSLTKADGSLGYDFYFTCIDSIVNRYQSNGCKALKNPFGFEKRILNQLPKAGKEVTGKLSFIGSVVGNTHKYRRDIIMELGKLEILDWWIGNLGQGIITKSKFRELIHFRLKNFLTSFLLEQKNNGGIYGREMYATLQSYNATLNVHGEHISQIGNMRLTEAGGLGVCQLIDYKPNAKDYFDPDYEAIYFNNLEELREKAKYIVNHPKVAEEIGIRAQKRTLKEHSMKAHVERFIEYTLDNLS